MYDMNTKYRYLSILFIACYDVLVQQWKMRKVKISSKSGLKMHLERFKNQNSALRASQTPTRMEIRTFIDLAEFIRQMAENIHTFGGSPIFSYGHPVFLVWDLFKNMAIYSPQMK